MTTPSQDDLKRELRELVRSRRQSLQVGSTDVRASAVAINAIELLRGWGITSGPIAAFMSFGHEPPTDLLVSTMADFGWEVLLPRVVDGSRLDWLPYDGMWDADLLGITTPQSTQSADLATALAIFVPAMAASGDGRRLGRGKGYYDRALAGLPRFHEGGPLRIAVVDAAGLLPEGTIPMSEHDAWLDAVLVG